MCLIPLKPWLSTIRLPGLSAWLRNPPNGWAQAWNFLALSSPLRCRIRTLFFSVDQGVVMSVRSIEFPRTGAMRAWVLGFIAALLAAVGFGGALFELVRRWTTQEEYSHGFLIPL